MGNPTLVAFERTPSFYEGTAAQRVSNQGLVASGDVWTDTDTGSVQKKTSAGGWLPISISGAGLVFPQAIFGVFQQGEFLNPTSARVAFKTTIFLVGAVDVYLRYYAFGTPTGKELYAVFGAVDDDDADLKALSPGARTCIPIATDLERQFPNDDKCIRMDLYTDAATEAGAKAYWEASSP